MPEKKTCDSCAGASRNHAGEDNPQQDKQTQQQEKQLQQRELKERLSQIKVKLIVLSGKGGVGKSTVAANLAVSLGLYGFQVGLLDVDIHGPSVPKLLHLEGRGISMVDNRIIPVSVSDNLKVISIGFLLRHQDDAVIWRGPLKMNIIRQFLGDVQWGPLDFLVIDSPPGTGDEPLSVCQLIDDLNGAVIVTTAQEMALADVRKSITFCHQLKLPVLGVVENMSGFTCPECGHKIDIFKSGGAENMAREMGVPFLGRIPLDPQITLSCDSGQPYLEHYRQTETARAFNRVLAPIARMVAPVQDAKPAAGNITGCQGCSGCAEKS